MNCINVLSVTDICILMYVRIIRIIRPINRLNMKKRALDRPEVLMLVWHPTITARS